MVSLNIEQIRRLADSAIIYTRGESLQKHGAFRYLPEISGEGRFVYEVDGNYGNYRTEVILDKTITTHCTCPYPGQGCKHVVAILLEILDQQMDTTALRRGDDEMAGDYLSGEEIRQMALEDREKRSKREEFKAIFGDMLKGDHLVTTVRGRQYQVTLHDPLAGVGHCSCPDFHTNKLATCKHLLFLAEALKKQKNGKQCLARETFPYIDIFWDSAAFKPRLYLELPGKTIGSGLAGLLAEMFDGQGLFRKDHLVEFIPYLSRLEGYKEVRVQEPVMGKLSKAAVDDELRKAATEASTEFTHCLRVTPYLYQQDGIRFGLYKRAVLIGDEMGLGKTLQAIGLGIMKKELFGFKKVLVITLSSLKQQWQREIERFSNEKACIVAGSAKQRKQCYHQDTSLFKITNYEAVLRDVTIIARFKPDVIILDEAQRIKNFATKTAEAVKSLPRQHAIVLTGTPLENKLEDVYSLVQFLDPDLLSPLWQFAADHFLLSRRKKGDIHGYVNLDILHKRLQPLVIRRRKEEVLDQLPELIVNDYFIDLSQEQAEIHAGFSRLLLPLLNKKFLTPMDIRRIQMLLLKMRQTCNSTYLIDRETNISPKLDELANILEELVVQNGRKVVIFSEWTTMTMLIGKQLSRAAIPFVELTGKVPVNRRQALIDAFHDNPDCKVFLSTDAGGTGLNLQAADCVVNFELPWNPAKMNQRIGRVNRIGQKSRCINVVNLIAKFSIEERIMAGIRLKQDLFNGVFDGGSDEVLFSLKKRQEMVDLLRQMMEEEPGLKIVESLPAEELAEDTPHFLNPEVLDQEHDFTGEEGEMVPATELALTEKEAHPTDGQTAEKMEEVLNQGMSFISGLLEMATGQKLAAVEGSEKMVTLDKSTGEVTLKFTLPGFAKNSAH
jgi:ERCC4-related helicase/predicted nucleic acid-binding Zn finger protein